MARYAALKDFSFVKEAWRTCFDDPDAFVDWNFSKNYHPENTIISEWEGTPASNMQLMPYRLRLGKKDYSVNYVSGVATLPDFRKRGLVRDLFTFAFPEMQKRNHPISLLVPFNYAFYEKFGYTQCYNRILRTADFLPEGKMLSAPDLNPSLIQRLDTIYRKEMQSKNGYVLRTIKDWQLILEDLLILSKGGIYLAEQEGRPVGYTLFTKKDAQFELHELCGICPIPHHCKTEPFAMARIIDAFQILKDLAEDFDGNLKIKITDPQISKNNLCLQIKDQSVTPCQTFDYSFDIQTFTALVFGFCDDFTNSGLFQHHQNYINLLL